MKKIIFILAFIICLFVFASCTPTSEISTPTEPENTEETEVVTTVTEESTEIEETSESPSETWTYTNPHDKSTEGVTETTFIDFITPPEETTEEPTQGEPVSEFVPHQKQIERTYRILMKAFITRDRDIVLNTIANNKDIFLYIITHRTSYTDEQSPFGYIYYPGQFEEGSFKNVIYCNSYVSNGTDIDFYGITVENVEVDGHNELHVTDNHHQYHIYICGPVDEEPFTIEEATIYIKYTHYTYTEISWGPDGDGYCHMSSVPTYHILNEEILRISYTDLVQLEATEE